MSLLTRFKQSRQDLKIFATVSLLAGMAYSIYDSTFNNFLDARFSLTGFQRSFLEFPRELPGFLVVFVSALLWFLCSRRFERVLVSAECDWRAFTGVLYFQLCGDVCLAVHLQHGNASLSPSFAYDWDGTGA